MTTAFNRSRSVPTQLATKCAAFALLLAATAGVSQAQVQQAHYQASGYPGAGNSMWAAHTANYTQGPSDSWTNAYGEPVVVPVGFNGPGCCMPCGGCGPGMGCGPMGGCGMNGMPCTAAGGGPYGPGGPFGGCGPYGGMDPTVDLYGGSNVGVDQCGPHYFDFAAEFVYWKRRDTGDPDVIFATLGINDVSAGVDEGIALTTNDVDFDWEPGMRLTGRYDLGALSVIEVGYSGLFEYGAVSQLNGAGNIFTGFSNFGIGSDVDGNGVIDAGEGGEAGIGLDSTELADTARLEVLSELHNAEISFRRYWVGYNPRVTGTWLAGFRYTRLSEDLIFGTNGATGTAQFNSQTENDLTGFQAGGDVWVTVRQGCRIGAQGKAGIYNNRAESAINYTSTDLAGPRFEVVKSDHVSFIGEGNVSAVFDVLPSVSVRAGYDVLFINTVALAANNFDFDNSPFLTGATRTPSLIEESSAFYHGFHTGLEYVW